MENTTSNITKLQIKVTKEILQRSKYCGQNDESVGANCAVALAIREIMPRAEVGSAIFPFAQDGNMESAIYLPFAAEDFIQIFDETLPDMRPFLEELSFEIQIPYKTLELLIPLEEIEDYLKDSKTLKILS